MGQTPENSSDEIYFAMKVINPVNFVLETSSDDPSQE
jgi:hypothetical protein